MAKKGAYLRITSTSGTVVAALVISLWSHVGQAREMRYKDMPLTMNPGESLLVSNFRGQVRLIAAAPGKPVILRARKTLSDKATPEETARFEALAFQLKRSGQTFVIEAKGPDNKGQWPQWLRTSATAPEMIFEIEAPPMSAEVLQHDGFVSVQGWRESVTIGQVTGQVRVSGGDGALNVQTQKGDVRIENHRGSVDVDSYGAKLTVADLDGNLDLTNFGGESTLTGVRGHVDLRTHAGATSLAKAEGSLDFMNGRGSLTVTAFEGPVRGQTDQGTVNATVEGDAEVSVESNQGTVIVRLPADSGASVRMQSDEGSLNPPEHIKPAVASNGPKSASGRMTGAGPKGAVALRSKAGNLRVR